jgi:hypothetical protein
MTDQVIIFCTMFHVKQRCMFGQRACLLLEAAKNPHRGTKNHHSGTKKSHCSTKSVQKIDLMTN